MILVISASSRAEANQASRNIGWYVLKENIACGLDLEAPRQSTSKGTIIITPRTFLISTLLCFQLTRLSFPKLNAASGCYNAHCCVHTPPKLNCLEVSFFWAKFPEVSVWSRQPGVSRKQCGPHETLASLYAVPNVMRCRRGDGPGCSSSRAASSPLIQ